MEGPTAIYFFGPDSSTRSYHAELVQDVYRATLLNPVKLLSDFVPNGHSANLKTAAERFKPGDTLESELMVELLAHELNADRHRSARTVVFDGFCFDEFQLNYVDTRFPNAIAVEFDGNIQTPSDQYFFSHTKPLIKNMKPLGLSYSDDALSIHMRILQHVDSKMGKLSNAYESASSISDGVYCSDS